jgi:hypothetical protein
MTIEPSGPAQPISPPVGEMPGRAKGAFTAKRLDKHAKHSTHQNPTQPENPWSHHAISLGRGAGNCRDRVEFRWRFPAPRSAVYARNSGLSAFPPNFAGGEACASPGNHVCRTGTSGAQLGAMRPAVSRGDHFCEPRMSGLASFPNTRRRSRLAAIASRCIR